MSINESNLHDYQLPPLLNPPHRLSLGLREINKYLSNWVQLVDKYNLTDAEYEAIKILLFNDGFIALDMNKWIATIPAFVFEGYEKRERRKSISTNLQLVQTWAIAFATVGLLIFEWLKYHGNCFCK